MQHGNAILDQQALFLDLLSPLLFYPISCTAWGLGNASSSPISPGGSRCRAPMPWQTRKSGSRCNKQYLKIKPWLSRKAGAFFFFLNNRSITIAPPPCLWALPSRRSLQVTKLQTSEQCFYHLSIPIWDIYYHQWVQLHRNEMRIERVRPLTT